VSDQEPAVPPTLQLIRGDAQPEELAALLAVLSARSADPAAGEGARRPARGRWGDPINAVRSVPAPGRGAWRASGLPH
jgi:Acyl-CoA carboxylase epsilon subunit